MTWAGGRSTHCSGIFYVQFQFMQDTYNGHHFSLWNFQESKSRIDFFENRLFGEAKAAKVTKI